MKHEFVNVNHIKLHYVTEGKGPIVVLLHGFPENWYAWRKQIPALAEHFRIVAPDLRGYGESDKPQNVEDYRLSVLSNDIAELIKSLGKEKAHIIGHDWGGAVAWRLAQTMSHLIDHLVILNSPHPLIFSRTIQSSFDQIKKSWYIFFFQIPFLPEFMIKQGSKKLIKQFFESASVNKNAFTDEDIDQYFNQLNQPGSLTASLHYYRAAFRNRNKEKAIVKQKINVPTLLIWGEEDKALGKELTYNMEPLFTGPFQIRYIPNCGHYVNEEQPELVNQLILDFLQKT